MKRSEFIKLLIATGAMTILATQVHAEERGTKEEAIALMNSAMAHVKKVGVTKAFDDFTNDKATWNSKDLYVSAVDWKGNSLAHGFNPKQVGRNLWEVKDNNGVFLIQEIVKTAQSKGEGWVNYQWPDPLTKKMADKTSLVRHIPGTEACLIVGIYR